MRGPRPAARRGAEGKRLCRRPRRPDAGPGPSSWPTRGVSEAQASPRQPPSDSRRGVRSLGRGRAGPSRVAKSPGQHGSRAAEPRGRATNPLGGAGAGVRRAGWRRRPAEAAPPNAGSFPLWGRTVRSLGDRRRPLSLAACASLAHSVAAD